MAKAVAAGWPKAMIEEAAAARQARVDRGEDVIVGVNKYRLATEDHLDTLEVDNPKVREGQIARIDKMKAERDEASVPGRAQGAARRRRRRIEHREQPARAGGRMRPAPAPRSARSRAAMEDELRPLRHPADPGEGRLCRALCRRRALGAGRSTASQAVARRLGRKPKLLVAKMGQDGHDRGANVIASAFGDMGFEVVSGPLFQTPEETVVLALDERRRRRSARLSLAAGHKTLIPELIQQLRDAGRADIKVDRRRRDPAAGLRVPARRGRAGHLRPRLQRGRMRGRRAAPARPQHAAGRVSELEAAE